MNTKIIRFCTLALTLSMGLHLQSCSDFLDPLQSQ